MKIEGKVTKVTAEREVFVIEDLPADNTKTKLRTAWLKG